MGPRTPITTSMSVALGSRRSDSSQQFEIERIARLQDIGWQTSNTEHPTQLPCQIAIALQDIVKRLPVSETAGLMTTCRLSEFLLHADGWKAWLDFAQVRKRNWV